MQKINEKNVFLNNSFLME